MRWMTGAEVSHHHLRLPMGWTRLSGLMGFVVLESRRMTFLLLSMSFQFSVAGRTRMGSRPWLKATSCTFDSATISRLWVSSRVQRTGIMMRPGEERRERERREEEERGGG